MACCKLDRLEGRHRDVRTAGDRVAAGADLPRDARHRARVLGREDEARALGAEIAALETVGYVSPHCDLMVQAGLRDRDGVERALGRCRQDRTSALVVASTAGSFLPIDDEPRAERARLEQIPVTMASPRAGVSRGCRRRCRSRAAPAVTRRVVAGKYRLLARAWPRWHGRRLSGAGRLHPPRGGRQAARRPRRERLTSGCAGACTARVIISGRLAHPRIVTVYDAGLDGDDMYLVMELVAGENLGQRLAREGGCRSSGWSTLRSNSPTPSATLIARASSTAT
jgi:hypothetical protein